MADDPDRLRRLVQEAKALAALDHPHIVTVFSVEEDEGSPLPDHGLCRGRLSRCAHSRRGDDGRSRPGARRDLWQMPYGRLTSAASSTAISSQPTSWSTRKIASESSISDWPNGTWA